MEIASYVVQHVSENEEVEGVERPADETGDQSVALIGALGRTGLGFGGYSHFVMLRRRPKHLVFGVVVPIPA